MAAPGEVKCRAVIRVRRGQDPNGVTIRSSNSIQVNGEDGAAVPGAAATVDFVCDPDATQADVYTRVAEPLVHQFVDQTLNVALIVLGAGGSGKTHSLLGGAGSDHTGLIPRIISGVFAAIDRKTEASVDAGSMMHVVSATHAELVGESVRDLFAPDPDRPDLDVVESEEGTHVGVMGKGGEGLERVGNTSAEGLQERLTRSNEERTGLANGTGDEHGVSTFFTIELDERVMAVGSSAGRDVKRECKFQVIELPAADALADAAEEVRTREGNEKHRAILAFAALARQLSGGSRDGTDFPYYKGSKTTQLLEDVLGGNCVTMVLGTVNQESAAWEGSAATVRYVKMLQDIKNYPMVEDDNLLALLRRYRRKVQHLQYEVQQLQSGEIAGDSKLGTDMADNLLAVQGLQERIVHANFEKVRLFDQNERLKAAHNALRTKYTELAKTKAELQQQLIVSETDRLKIGQALIDMQVEKEEGKADIEKDKFELKSQLVAEQYNVKELEMRQQSVAATVEKLEAERAQLLEEKQQVATEFVALKNNLLNARKETELHKRKTEELSIELLNLVNARDALSAEKDTMALQHAEALAAQGNEKMSAETVAELDQLREGSKELHEEVAKLKFTIQQKEVEYGQLRLQLEKALMEQTQVAKGQASEAESTVTALQEEMANLERELKQKDRLMKEQESDLQREAARYQELYQEVVMSRQRLQDSDKKFRDQVKEHMEDLSRLTSRATPRATQLNQETHKLIEQMTHQMQISYAERESTLTSDLALVRERLARATRKNRQLFIGYRDLRHKIEDSATRGSTPTIRREEEVEEGELEGEGQIMEEEMASMRQRVNSLEEDLDRQRQKAITATEAYQKMVVDLQQRHAGTVAELEMALKELEQLQGYKDLYSKIESGQASKDSQGMAAMMQENLGLKSEIATLRQELQAEKERTDVAGRANSRQSVLDDEQVREYEEVRRTGAHPSAPDFAPATARELPAQGGLVVRAERILREENARLNRELESAKEELGQERGGGMASARAIAEGRASFHKGLKEFTVRANPSAAPLFPPINALI